MVHACGVWCFPTQCQTDNTADEKHNAFSKEYHDLKN